MKRAIRIVWVLATNCFVVCFTVNRLSRELLDLKSQNFEVRLEFIFEILLPVLGIVVELIGWKLARSVNVGYLTAAASLWLGEAVWWHSDPFFGVLLIISVGLFILAGITEIIYRRTSPLQDALQVMRTPATSTKKS
jgi:hypothetical protein